MAKNFRQLPRVVNNMSDRLSGAVTKLVKIASRTAGKTAVETTRVDTGKARSNWRANLNGPATGVIPAYAPGNKLGFSERGNAVSAVAQQRSVIEQFNVRSSKAVFISNSVPYIGILNNGGANVSPGNMAQLAIQAAKVRIQNERILKTLRGTGVIR
mgnify:CR=1 FL=1